MENHEGMLKIPLHKVVIFQINNYILTPPKWHYKQHVVLRIPYYWKSSKCSTIFGCFCIELKRVGHIFED